MSKNINDSVVGLFTEEDIKELRNAAITSLIENLDDMGEYEYLWDIEGIQGIISDTVEEVVREEIKELTREYLKNNPEKLASLIAKNITVE